MSQRAPAVRAHEWEVQVRLVAVDGAATDVRAALLCLSPAERAYADRGVPAVRTRRVLLRAGLRRLAGEVLGLPAADVALVDPPGRPALTGTPAGRHIDLGCSASGPLGLVAVGRGCRVGIDVEGLAAAPAADAEDWLTTTERTALAVLPADQRAVALTECWTRKEAVLKGVGTGLRVHPRTVDTTASGSGSGPAGDWELLPLDVPAGWVATLAVRPHAPGPTASAGTERSR